MAHFEFNSECQYVFKTRLRCGQKCNRINCKNHDKYNCNLAKYLKLPSTFFNVAKLLDKDIYFLYVNMFERSLVSDNKKIIRMFRNLISSFESIRNNRVKELIVIFAYKFVDNHLFLVNDKKFKKAIDEKLDEFILTPKSKFTDYMSCNFQSGKRFLSVQRNNEYRKRVVRLYMKTIVLTNRWFNETMEKRYSPSGIGAIEAKSSFIRNYGLLY